MVSRREFLKIGGAAAGGLFFVTKIGGKVQRVFAQIPGGTLDPANVLKYQTPMLIPPAMPRGRQGQAEEGEEHRLLRDRHAPVPTADPAGHVASDDGLGIRTRRGSKWVSAFQRPFPDNRSQMQQTGPESSGSTNWWMPTGTTCPTCCRLTRRCTGRIRRAGRLVATPARPSPARLAPYIGPVPMVTHVHGAVGVGDESDGYAEAWYLPASRMMIPGGYATKGTWYDFFSGKAAPNSAKPGVPVSPRSSIRMPTALRPSGTTTTRWA